MDTQGTIGAAWHVVFTALKWLLIWAISSGLVTKLVTIYEAISH